MDIDTALEQLERVRMSLNIQASETKNFWEDNMRYKFYNNIIDYYDPETINFVAEFNRINDMFESWLYEMRNMQTR